MFQVQLKYFIIGFFLISLIGYENKGYSQPLTEKPRKSPVGLSSYKKEGFYVKVTFGRPSIKNEDVKVFGNIVPYRRLWRTGNDEATEITFSENVNFMGEEVPAGTYSLFTIPDTAEWNVILNKEVGQWGIYKYNPEKDIINKKTPLYKSPKSFLTFSMYVERADNGADLILIWRFSSIRIPIRRIEE